jgi:chromosome segregation ATPase
MAKDVVKAAGRAAVETALEQFLPTMLRRFDELQQQISDVRQQVTDVRREVSDLRRHVDDKFERNQELINELGLRINSVGAKVEAFLEFTRRDSLRLTLI